MPVKKAPVKVDETSEPPVKECEEKLVIKPQHIQEKELKQYKLECAKIIHRKFKGGRNWEILAEKDKHIGLLRKKMSKLNAHREAWAQMMETYAPEAIKPPWLRNEDKMEELAEYQPDHKSSSFVSDTEWAYANLGVNVKKENAPSLGAYSLLVWARDNQTDFFRQIMPKCLDLKAKMLASPGSGETQEDISLAELKDLLG